MCSCTGRIFLPIKKEKIFSSLCIGKETESRYNGEVDRIGSGDRSMRKKPVCFLALTLALACLTGCALPETDSVSIPPVQTVSSAAAGQSCTLVSQRGDYNGLPSDSCRRLYQQMLACAGKIADQKEKNGYPLQPAVLYTQLSDKDTQLTVMAFFNDNPQMFWVSNQYTYTYSFTATSVQLYSRVSPTVCSSMQKQLQTAVIRAMAGTSAKQSELEREENIYQALADRCSYANSAAGKEQDWQDYTSYGALVKGKAVCDGYARAMQLLCAEAGLSCRLVNGSSKGAAHIWNLIRIGGKWYHFDGTWMDSSVRTYDYFNLTDTLIRQDHTICPSNGNNAADSNLPMPSASSMDANYYQARAVQLTSLDNNSKKKLATALAQAAASGRTVLALHLGEHLPYRQTVDELFNSMPYFFQSCVAAANRALPGGKKLYYDGMHYSTAEAQRGISIQLTYAKNG